MVTLLFLIGLTKVISMQAITSKNTLSEQIKSLENESSLTNSSNPYEGNVYYAVAFLLLIGAMNGVQLTIDTKSKEIQANASVQSRIVHQLTKSVRFLALPSNPTPIVIHQVSEANKEVAARQQELQEQLIYVRQGGQILLTSGNSDVNTMEQNANANSTILNTIHTILTLISGMSPAKAKQ